jgi:NAD(P)H-hydrate epimerase
MLTLTREQCRQVDRRAIEHYGIPGLVLMENAGRGVADGICRLFSPQPVLICCGKGNNAGDGFVIARHLELRGYPVRVLTWANAEELAGDAGKNYEILRRASRVPIHLFGSGHDAARLDEELGWAAVIVDALLGTGARGAPKPPLDAVIAQLNSVPPPRIAVDLPSGLDCDSGEPAQPTIRAQHTFTLLAAKPGFFTPPARKYIGELHLCDIGVPPKVIDEVLVSKTA